VKRFEVHLTRRSTKLDGVRIAQLSDLHNDPPYTAELVERALKAAKRLNPELGFVGSTSAVRNSGGLGKPRPRI
jgi:predicted MPP superfamily phosphohydrolase